MKQRFGCIYRLTNLVTGKTYIGKTVRFQRRMREHKSNSEKKSKTYLSNSVKKHGWDNFKVEIIIDDVPEEDLDNLEISYIAVENTMVPFGYNLTLGGDGRLGYIASEQTRKKMRQASLRQHANRDRIGSVCFGKSVNKYLVCGPCPDQKHIGLYFTKEKGEQALKHYLKTGERMDSDRTERKKGTGSIQKNRKRYRARYKKNKKRFSKTFDTREECEEWLKQELKF